MAVITIEVLNEYMRNILTEARLCINFKQTRLTMATKKQGVVQVKNPKTQRYVKIDRNAGKIISHKQSSGPYKGIPVARKRAAAG